MALAAFPQQAQRAERGEAAGLVPSKTSAKHFPELSVIPGTVGAATAGCVSFSQESAANRRVRRLKRSVWASGHLHGLGEKGFRGLQAWFVTLTYVRCGDWLPRHIAAAVDAYRRYCKAAKVPCRYTWVAELQTRGAVHYHLLAWLPVGVSMPHWDKARGNRDAFWPHGMTQTAKALSGVGYLMKYLSKLGDLTKFPKGLRLYGIGGLTEVGRRVRQWYNLPAWAKLSHGVGELVRVGRSLVRAATGEVCPSPYRVHRFPGGMALELVRPLPDRFHDGAWSAWSAS